MSDPAIDPALDAFDAVELQGGLLMQVENVHERLRQARERHRVMRGIRSRRSAPSKLVTSG
jgi:hypothetical protein